MLRKRSGIGVRYLVFDVLAHDGEPTMRVAYQERRERSKSSTCAAPTGTPPVFDDPGQLWGIVVGTGLEGVVAKKHYGVADVPSGHGQNSQVDGGLPSF